MISALDWGHDPLHYLGGQAVARIGRRAVSILKTSLATFRPAPFFRLGPGHASVVGVDAAPAPWERGATPELHNEVEDFILYYNAGRFVSSIASRVVPLVRLIPRRVACRMGSR